METYPTLNSTWKADFCWIHLGFFHFSQPWTKILETLCHMPTTGATDTCNTSVRDRAVKGEAPQRWGTMMRCQPEDQPVANLVGIHMWCKVVSSENIWYIWTYPIINTGREEVTMFNVHWTLKHFFFGKKLSDFFPGKVQSAAAQCSPEGGVRTFFSHVFSRQKSKWVRKMMIAIFTYIYIYMCQ